MGRQGLTLCYLALVENASQTSVQSAIKCSSVPEIETGKNITAKKYLLPSGIVGNVANGKQCITFDLFIISRIFKIRNEIEKLL